MFIQELSITQLRNLKSILIHPDIHINFIVGKNGSGKTSLLEAIYFLTHARSFRTHKPNKLISHEEKSATVFARVKTCGQGVNKLGIQREQGKTTIKINGELVKSTAQIAQHLPVKIINQDVHNLIQEGPTERRSFVDWGVFHVEHRYAEHWRRFRSVVTQRNAALRQKLSPAEIAVWNEPLIQSAETISHLRAAYLEQFIPLAQERIRSRVGFENFQLFWQQGWSKELSFRQALEQSFRKDREQGFTGVGPHKADLRIYLAKELAKDQVSRGQQKWMAMELSFLQLELLANVKGEGAAVVLIDDLAAEFDEHYQERILRSLRALKLQSFITLIDKDYSNRYLTAQDKMFHVEHGAVKQLL